MELGTNKVFGYEMLLRSKEIENPEYLFKLAEKQDKLFDLDMHSVGIAFDTINQHKLMFEGIHLFVNILPSTIGNPTSLTKLNMLKSKLKSNVKNVVFEITEEKKEEELMMCKSMVGDMKEQGFMVALDDIGKGDSTLPYVLELEPNIIKLDRYYAQELSNKPKKQKAIELMIKLFGDDTMIILEGLEQEQDVITAKRLGIRYGQGYVLGRPQPLDYYFSRSAGREIVY